MWFNYIVIVLQYEKRRVPQAPPSLGYFLLPKISLWTYEKPGKIKYQPKGIP